MDAESFESAAVDPIDRSLLLARTGLASFEHLAEVGSTMDRAREIAGAARAGLPAAVVADRQTQGRGRQGARWWQPPGSLTVSLVLDVATVAAAGSDGSVCVATAANQGVPPAIWSLACGVALAEAVAAVEPAAAPLVRWPNDIEARGRKLAGILVESAPGGRVIFGIGVNTTGTTADAPAALRDRIVTLPDLTGRRLPRQALLVEFLPRFLRLLGEIDADPRRLIARYRPLCALDGHPLTIHRAGGTLRGVCRGIAADGALVLDTPAGRVAVISGSLTDPAEVWRGDASAS